jgi:hypothetical protein
MIQSLNPVQLFVSTDENRTLLEVCIDSLQEMLTC